ncbi:putative NAD(P)-dependent cholesterol dehydrogenase [Calothrix sp. NIES-4071]|nr:putative NAD(P)-dependent cholesterol dehydrogenase [Calothrix sp. NIES-4071]BAZ54837.1 putative NAD(P)-dependent cholesterol dehydrogenase [Calothrix sp. NIES-4105]
MKILVTGGTGFLGRRLAERLNSLNLSDQVTVFGRNIEVGKQLEAQGIRFLAGDICDADAVLAACKRQEYVFHCAALSTVWGKYKDFYNINVVGTRNVIRGCEIYEIQRLINISTSSLYYNYSHRLNVTEDSVVSPVNAYAMTKYMAETLINKVYHRGLSVITIRPSAIFGCHHNTILSSLIEQSRKGILFINDGKALIDLTYVDNVVDALLLCLTAPSSLSGRIFNISNNQPIYLIELLKLLSTQLGYELKLRPVPYLVADKFAQALEFASKKLLFGKEPVLTRYALSIIAFSQTLDITPAIEELNYQPRVSLEEGLENFSQWWRQRNRV